MGNGKWGLGINNSNSMIKKLQMNSWKNIKTPKYKKDEYEEIEIKNKTYRVYSIFYPVWQGMRNMDKAVTRIKNISNL